MSIKYIKMKKYNRNRIKSGKEEIKENNGYI